MYLTILPYQTLSRALNFKLSSNDNLRVADRGNFFVRTKELRRLNWLRKPAKDSRTSVNKSTGERRSGKETAKNLMVKERIKLSRTRTTASKRSSLDNTRLSKTWPWVGAGEGWGRVVKKKKKQREGREVRADPNGSSVLLSLGNRVRLLEQEGLCGLLEILGSTPKVRWWGNLRRCLNIT